MDGIEDLLHRLAEYMKQDLAKESLTEKSERKRHELVQLIEQVAAKQIAGKYEPASPRRSETLNQRRILQGNIVPTPFSRTTDEVVATKELKSHNDTKTEQNKMDVMVTYETIPFDLMPNDETVTVSKPPQPQPTQTHGVNHEEDNERLYEEPFILTRDQVQDAAESSDSDTDYEEYCDEDEKDGEDAKKTNKGVVESRNKPLKRSEQGSSRRQRIKAVLADKQYSGTLYQKGLFQIQLQRRYCFISNGRFYCMKTEKSTKFTYELTVKDYEIVHNENKKDAKTSHPHELRLSCPGRETLLFYTDSRQVADEWCQELKRVAAFRTNSLESNTEENWSSGFNDDFDKQSVISELSTVSSISGGSFDKGGSIKPVNRSPPLTEEPPKKSKFQTIFGQIGKKPGSKSKVPLQSIDFSNPQKVADEQKWGYVRILSEEFTGERWFKRFCRIENGQLNCYKDAQSEWPEFSISLVGSKLEPINETGALKIKLVKDGKEHCLEMEDFMEHGKWLMALIRETGYASQLALSKQPTKAPAAPETIYEQIRMFCQLEGTTMDDSCVDDEPPPLPNYSPPSTPTSLPDFDFKGFGETQEPAPEGIYLEPAELLVELEKIKPHKKTQNISNNQPQNQEESVYMNKEFAKKCLNSKEKNLKKEKRLENGALNNSSSSPNLAIVTNAEPSSTKTHGVIMRERKGGKGVPANFRPSSALESSGKTKEPLVTERKISEGNESKDTVRDSFDRQEKRKTKPEDSISDSSHALKTTGNNAQQKKPNDTSQRVKSQRDELWDDMQRKHIRPRVSTSVSTEDLSRRDADKKLVHNLVQMFEKNSKHKEV